MFGVYMGIRRIKYIGDSAGRQSSIIFRGNSVSAVYYNVCISFLPPRGKYRIASTKLKGDFLSLIRYGFVRYYVELIRLG